MPAADDRPRPTPAPAPVGPGPRALWLRGSLAVVALGLWAGAAWLSTHSSADGSILGRYSTRFFALLLATAVLAAAATAAQLPLIYGLLHRRRLQLLTIAVSTALGLTLAEALVRLLDPGGISYYEHLSQSAHQMADDEIVYRLRPRFDWHTDVAYRTNELGLRDDPVGPKPAAELRLLALGDSITFGLGVRAEETYAARVEALLAEHRPVVRTINAGVSGYNTVQELALLRRHADRIDPDVVLLLYHQNDIDRRLPLHEGAADLAGRDHGAVRTLQLALWRSWLFRVLTHRLRVARADAEERVDRDGPGWQASIGAIEELAAYCDERRTRLAIVFYRWRAAALNDALVADLRAISSERGIPLTDTLRWFDGLDTQRLRNSAVDSHPNAAGHDVLARGIVEFLQTEGLLAPR